MIFKRVIIIIIHTIIVCLNSEKTIQRTIESILKQKYKNSQIWIKVGIPTDGTINAIKKFKKKNINVLVKKDISLYDAMNQAIDWLNQSRIVEKNDIIHFLNSDDHLADNEIFSKINSLTKVKKEIICGSVAFKDKKGNIKRILSSRFVDSKYGMLLGAKPPHPGFFCSAKLYLKRKYLIKYTIAADYELMLQIIMKNKEKVATIDDILVNMAIGGKSTANYRSFFKGQIESLRVRQEIFGSMMGYFGLLKPFISYKRK